MRQVYIGADHGGFKLKDRIISELREEEYLITDLSGSYDPEDDYPDIAFKLAETVVKENVIGILICRSSAGVCIAANKVKGARAATAINVKQARKSREDDDVNILCLSADFVNDDDNVEMVKEFLKSIFMAEERFIRRLQKIKKYENA